MELRFFIISVACFSCLVPQAFFMGILKTKAAAVDATKGAVPLGAKALLKKGAAALVAKGVAAVVAKGVLIKKGILAAKGAALLAAKSAALKGATASKGALLNGAVALGTEVMKAKGNVSKHLPVDGPAAAVKRLAVIPPPPVISEFLIDYILHHHLIDYIVHPFQLSLPHHSPPISIVTVDVQQPILAGVKDQPNSDSLSARTWGKLETANNFKSKFLGGVIRAVHDAPAKLAPAS